MSRRSQQLLEGAATRVVSESVPSVWGPASPSQACARSGTVSVQLRSPLTPFEAMDTVLQSLAPLSSVTLRLQLKGLMPLFLNPHISLWCESSSEWEPSLALPGAVGILLYCVYCFRICDTLGASNSALHDCRKLPVFSPQPHVLKAGKTQIWHVRKMLIRSYLYLTIYYIASCQFYSDRRLK